MSVKWSVNECKKLGTPRNSLKYPWGSPDPTLGTTGIREQGTLLYLHDDQGERQYQQDGEFVQNKRRENMET